MRMSTASTFFLSTIAVVPRNPISPSSGCPQRLGHPVQYMRTGRSNSIVASSSSASFLAFIFVSTIPNPQNWLPVQLTMPSITGPGLAENLVSRGSASRAGTTASGTPERMKFCSAVRRMSPSPYDSARRAISSMSSGVTRPLGTASPTQFRPACFCGLTPNRRRLSRVESSMDSPARSNATPSGMRFSTSARNASMPPMSSMHQMRRHFWRFPLAP
mmetsp:Transcript_10092/g.35144  ORF Transcript_10092/g.35144 Transcript_10092/m.35144 type:complete len:217 (-) Transcript_10092:1164-1814(-)